MDFGLPVANQHLIKANAKACNHHFPNHHLIVTPKGKEAAVNIMGTKIFKTFRASARFNITAGDVNTRRSPTSRKDRLREDMERTFKDASADGIQTIILYAGNFIERKISGNWFESHIAAKFDTGKIMYPGPLDKTHAWAFIPDVARAMNQTVKEAFDAIKAFNKAQS
ncbi:MAG: hypothetical protein COA52_09855 [Hyphomicrobiales bacterium]|nr:MAG: hypothetical protein COA52_09855 [Hyphomicrobiales bacterium]